MALAAAYQVWEKGTEDYDFAADEIEPEPCKMDGNADAQVKDRTEFDQDNLVDVEFV